MLVRVETETVAVPVAMGKLEVPVVFLMVEVLLKVLVTGCSLADRASTFLLSELGMCSCDHQC